MTANVSDSSSSNRIKAAEKAFNIIETLQDLDGCGVKELADQRDIPKSTAHVYLKTLQDTGYVVKRDQEYHLSLRFLKHGGYVRHHLEVYQASREKIDELSRVTGEVATVGFEEGGLRVLLYRTEPAEAISDNAPTGEHTRMHWTALGKALLSQLSDDKIHDIVAQYGLPEATENTITDGQTLLNEVEKIRSQGYAIENEERVMGIKSLAVPITDLDGSAGNAAISIAGPKREFGKDRIETELLPEIQNTTNHIELRTNYY